MTNKVDFNENTDFTKLTDAELRLAEKKFLPYTQVYLNAVEEICRRERKTIKKTEKTQSSIRLMTFIILIFTAIMLYFTGATYFKSISKADIQQSEKKENQLDNK